MYHSQLLSYATHWLHCSAGRQGQDPSQRTAVVEVEPPKRTHMHCADDCREVDRRWLGGDGCSASQHASVGAALKESEMAIAALSSWCGPVSGQQRR
jgi:hypothetical protein